jgi:DNA-directed RNA polymerase I subunit RPA1
MTVRDNDGSIVQFLYGDDGVDVVSSKFLDRFSFLEQNFTSLITNYNSADIMSRVNTEQADLYKHEVRKAMKVFHKEHPTVSKAEIYKKHRGDPVISKYHPLRYFGSISEKIDDQLKQYVDNDSIFMKREKEAERAPKTRY